VPVLLGSGIPFFGKPDNLPACLDGLRVVEGSGVTHLRFTVRRQR
jgi:hypothetical protein